MEKVKWKKAKIRPIIAGAELVFRSNYQKGDYQDKEQCGHGGMTDPSAFVPTKTLVARVMRGEYIPPRYVPEYEFEGDVDIDKAEAEMDPTRRPGFDALAEAGSILKAGAQAKKQIALDQAEAKKRASDLEAQKQAVKP